MAVLAGLFAAFTVAHIAMSFAPAADPAILPYQFVPGIGITMVTRFCAKSCSQPNDLALISVVVMIVVLAVIRNLDG